MHYYSLCINNLQQDQNSLILFKYDHLVTLCEDGHPAKQKNFAQFGRSPASKTYPYAACLSKYHSRGPKNQDLHQWRPYKNNLGTNSQIAKHLTIQVSTLAQNSQQATVATVEMIPYIITPSSTEEG